MDALSWRLLGIQMEQTVKCICQNFKMYLSKKTVEWMPWVEGCCAYEWSRSEGDINADSPWQIRLFFSSAFSLSFLARIRPLLAHTVPTLNYPCLHLHSKNLIKTPDTSVWCTHYIMCWYFTSEICNEERIYAFGSFWLNMDALHKKRMLPPLVKWVVAVCCVNINH